MIGALRIYLALSWSEFVAYRVVFFLYALWAVFPPLIYLAVWATISGGGPVGSFTTGDFVAYYLVFMLVNHLVGSIEIHTAEWEIRQGSISARLLLPVHPAIRLLASNLGFKAIGLFVVIPGIILLALIFHPSFHTSPAAIGLAVVATVLAALLQFLVGTSIALLAFWITRADAVNQLHDSLLFFLSGQLAPLALLPGALRAVATVLPYRYMLSFPVELATGSLAPADVAAGFGLQAFWLAAGWVLFQLAWTRGLRHYSAVGG
ncbi:MAG TPA: ABC-2 family transporter protein [Chloroflexota bacterium]